MNREQNLTQIRETLEAINSFSDIYEGLANNAVTDRHIEIVALLGSLILNTLRTERLQHAVSSFSQELAKEPTQI